MKQIELAPNAVKLLKECGQSVNVQVCVLVRVRRNAQLLVNMFQFATLVREGAVEDMFDEAS